MGGARSFRPSLIAIAIAAATAGCDLVFAPGAGPTRDGPAGPGGDGSLTTDASHLDAPPLPDAGADGNMAVDTDGDLIFDDNDNCVDVPNPAQEDKDVDGAGDLCDPCPHLAGVTGADIDDDLDGLGNGCDPRPFTGGDTATFFGFYNVFDILGWTQNPPAQWNSGGGLLIQDDHSVPGARIDIPVFIDDGIVTVGVSGISEAPGAGLQHSLAVITGVATDHEYECRADAPAGSNGELRYTSTIDTATDTQITAWAGGEIVANHITLSAQTFGAGVTCHVQTDPGIDPQAGIGGVAAAHDGQIALDVYLLAVAVDYVFVARQGP